MPAPWNITIETSEPGNSFTFSAQQINFDGRSILFTTDKPCQALQFMDALQQAGEGGISGDRAGQQMYAEVKRQCEGWPGGEQGQPPPTPAPVDNPASTGRDAPPSAAGETAQSLSAPDPKVVGQAELTPAAPGQSDGRTLQEQYRDPNNPMPDHDVASNLASQGVPPDQITGEVQRVIHNDPPRAQPHPAHGQDKTQHGVTAVDPVPTIRRPLLADCYGR